MPADPVLHALAFMLALLCTALAHSAVLWWCWRYAQRPPRPPPRVWELPAAQGLLCCGQEWGAPLLWWPPARSPPSFGI